MKGGDTDADDGTRSSSLKRQRREQQDELSRQHIIDAAERVFSRRGFHEATVREIATEAEFSPGSIYNFFENKDDLFAKVMERKGLGMVRALEAAVEDIASPTERLHALADAQLSYFSTHRDFYRLILRTAGPSWWTLKAELDDTSTDRFQRAIDIETAIFEDGIEAGEFLPLDPETMAVLFLGILQAYLTRWLLSDDESIGQLEAAYSPADLHQLLDRAFCVDGHRPGEG